MSSLSLRLVAVRAIGAGCMAVVQEIVAAAIGAGRMTVVQEIVAAAAIGVVALVDRSSYSTFSIDRYTNLIPVIDLAIIDEIAGCVKRRQN